MALLAMNEMTTYRWSFEEDVRAYSEAGLAGIGVWRQKLTDFGDERGAELIRDLGLGVSSLLWAGGFTGSDGRSYADSVEDAKEAIRQAALLHARCLVLYTGSRGGHTHNHARRLIRGALSELAPVADAADVMLAIEPMHPGCAADWTFLTNLNDTLQLMESVDSRRLRLVFDTYHLGHEADIMERLPELVPQVGLVQLGDAKMPPQGEQNRCLLGEGVLPLRELVAAFEEAGYDGFYEIELMGEELEAMDYQDLLRRSVEAAQALLAGHRTPENTG